MDANEIEISYAEALKQFRNVGSINHVFENLFDEIGENYLHDVRHAISIGPGPGDVDFAFLKKTTPNLTKFTAVEKDVSCMKELEGNVKKYLPDDVMVDLHLAPAQKWQGPQEKADLVFTIHSIYYFNEEDRKKIFENCFHKWLKPSGKLFIMVNKDMYDTPTPNYLNDIFRETGRVPLIESYIIKKELLKLGCTLDRSFHYQYYQDLQSMFDHAVPFVMIHANPPYENENVPKEAIKKLIKSGNKGYASGTMFSVIKKY